MTRPLTADLLALSAALLTLMTMSLSGCNIVGPASYLATGGPKVDAEHKLANVPTLVFIDDRNSVVSPVSLRKVIADKICEDLMVKGVLKTTINSQDAMTIAAQRDRNNQIMSIEEIGKAVGASQVIYIEMLQFQDTPDGFTPRPTAAGNVKVLDLQAKKRVYPGPDAPDPVRLVQVATREVDPGLYSTRAGRLQVFEALAVETGSSIARLFYKHESRPLGANLNPR